MTSAVGIEILAKLGSSFVILILSSFYSKLFNASNLSTCILTVRDTSIDFYTLFFFFVPFLTTADLGLVFTDAFLVFN